MVCYIGIVHVSPECYSVTHLLPLCAVFPYAFLTFLYEGLNTVFLDLRLSADAKLLLYFQLYRKSVGIPAAFTKYVIALHYTVTKDKVLDGSCLNMSDMGFAVGCRGSLDPCESRIAFS